jgi:spore coat protein U-like protein
MKRYLAALAATLALTAATAQAAPPVTLASKTMKVSTDVIPACTFTLTDFALGNYDANNTLTATHPITFQCTNGTTFQLVLSNFTGKLTSGTDTLNYTLANKNGTWLDSTPLSVMGTGASQSETLTATVAGGQYVPAGTSYAETITFALEL